MAEPDGDGWREPVRIVFGKWGGRAHWEYDAVRLGSDRHGTWLGAPVGTSIARPGRSFVTRYRHVALVPAAGFLASFNEDVPGAVKTRIYVDICTPPWWDGPLVRSIDLDLDVILDRTGRLWIDDEDEFADHRERFGYPAEVVQLALDTCAQVHRAIADGEPPFDGHTAEYWLGVLGESE